MFFLMRVQTIIFLYKNCRSCSNRVFRSTSIGPQAHIWVNFSCRVHFWHLFCISTTLSPSKSGNFHGILSPKNLLVLKMTIFRCEDVLGCQNGCEKRIQREKLPLTCCFGHLPTLFNTRLVLITNFIQKNYRILMVSLSLKKNIAIFILQFNSLALF